MCSFGGVLAAADEAGRPIRRQPRGLGVELPLFHTGGVGATFTMMGFGLPLGAIVGPLLWAAATRRSVRLRNDVALGLLVVPLSGIEISRPYWGLISLPVVLVFGTDEVVDAWTSARLRARRKRTSATRAQIAASDASCPSHALLTAPKTGRNAQAEGPRGSRRRTLRDPRASADLLPSW